MLFVTRDCMGHVFTCTCTFFMVLLSQEEPYVQCVVPPVRPKSGKVFQLIYWPIDLLAIYLNSVSVIIHGEAQ